MPKYNLPVNYSVWGLVQVEADSLEDAVIYYFEHQDEIPLPPLDEVEYVDGSDYLDGSQENQSVKGVVHWLNEFWEECVKPTD